MDNNQNENIKRDSYLKAIGFKNTGMDPEAIYARLEKQGVPEDIAREVAKNVFLQKQRDKENKAPVPLNSYSVWAKILKTLFPKLRI